jgi:carboxypeptidase Q
MRRSLLLVLLALAAPAVRAQQAPDTAAVAAYSAVANRIIAAATADSSAWKRLAELADTFGPRLSGSDNLEHAIDWILQQMRTDGLENVRGEPVMVPRWVRGYESATLTAPYRDRLPMLGLGGSIATPPEGIEAEVMAVENFAELDRRCSEAQGKMVLFDVPFTNYGQTVQYRAQGAIRAARCGAVASLIRSVASGTMATPHTGSMAYADTVRRIPAAALTVEDAARIHRMVDRGTPVRLHLMMSAQTLPDRLSRNVVAELRGTERPDEVVVFGGHIDSWDVGQGAMDDGGGCVAAWEALRILKALGLRPRRTIRVVMWTNEENGLRGGNGYRDAHLNELDKHVLAIESDGGTFQPTGFGFSGRHDAYAVVRQVGPLLASIGATNIVRGGGGADIGPMRPFGVPQMSLNVDGRRYFHYHHTEADTMDKIDPVELARCVAAMAVMAYVVADLPQTLPRGAE